MPQSLLLPIVGQHFRPPAKIILHTIGQTHELWLKPEPSNPYDSNAIQVLIRGASFNPSLMEDFEDQRSDLEGYGFEPSEMSSQDWHLGYIPKDQAALLVKRLNAAIETKAQWEDNNFESIGLPGAWPAKFDFDMAGKPSVRFDLPLSSELSNGEVA